MRKSVRIGTLILGFCLIMTASLLYQGILQMNHPSEERYQIKGVDVSHYQGEIDWSVLAKQDIRFAYIKATEGSAYRDERFAENWLAASQTNLRIGAYHFFSFDSNGHTQAENFMGAVESVEGMLPPAVDVEPYGKHRIPDDSVLDELACWIYDIEVAYGIKPVIYTTKDLYNLLHSTFPEYDIWIRSVYTPPSKGMTWSFWQYSNRMRLDGYSGEERFIDMNVFFGSEDDFQIYGY